MQSESFGERIFITNRLRLYILIEILGEFTFAKSFN